MENGIFNRDRLKLTYYLYDENLQKFQLCLSLLQIGEYRAACGVANYYIKSNEVCDLWPYFIRGVAHWELGNLEKAIKDFKKIHAEYKSALRHDINLGEVVHLRLYLKQFPNFKRAITMAIADTKEK